jgi:hypothetical protein
MDDQLMWLLPALANSSCSKFSHRSSEQRPLSGFSAERKQQNRMHVLYVLVTFCWYDKIPEKNNLKEGRLILTRGFRVSVCGWLALLLLGCGKAETSWPKGVAARNLFTSWLQEAVSKRRWEGLGTRNTLQIHAPSDLLPSTKPHLLIGLSAMNSSMD